MKSLKSNSCIESMSAAIPISEQQGFPLSVSNANTNFQRVRLPRLHKAPKRSKTSNGKPKCNLKELNRQNKYDVFVDQILDLQTCVKKTYGNAINVECLTRMKKSIESLNRQKSIKITENGARDIEPPSTSSSDNEIIAKPATKPFYKMTKRVQFKRRLDMAQKCLVILGFEGVFGDVFKQNIWEKGPLKLYLRREAVKGVKKLLEDFQVVLFIQSSRVRTSKLIDFFNSKNIHFDGVYRTKNSKDFEKDPNPKQAQKVQRRHLKYSESIQDYSQIALDFGLQHETLEKILIVSSLSLDYEEIENTTGKDLLFRKYSNHLYDFLPKAVPNHKNSSVPLPITFLVPNPRASHSFSGCSFMEIVNSLDLLSSYSNRGEDNECSWFDGFMQLKMNPQQRFQVTETSFYQFSLAREKFEVNKEKVMDYIQLRSKSMSNLLENYESPCSSPQNKQRCRCPTDMKEDCIIKDSTSCSSERALRNYSINGKEIPSSFLKNRFIVFNSSTVFPYRFIHDHTGTTKSNLVNITIM
ncbi:unnamed protein product [Blepharisma stoltei]|uniref:Uncharacterized protein n=1 Tax=Blepharisma stoltei TaxID=1481888 RepID=A0AAU9IEX4_9CILI|nr:unnamed protein product [Blepharisma stoltei]